MVPWLYLEFWGWIGKIGGCCRRLQISYSKTMWLWFIFTSLIVQLLVTTVCNVTKNTFPSQILNNAYSFLYYSVDFPNINGNHWAFALWCLLSCTYTFLHLVLMDSHALGVWVFRRAVSFKDNTGASNLILLEHQVYWLTAANMGSTLHASEIQCS